MNDLYMKLSEIGKNCARKVLKKQVPKLNLTFDPLSSKLIGFLLSLWKSYVISFNKTVVCSSQGSTDIEPWHLTTWHKINRVYLVIMNNLLVLYT